MEKYVFLIFFLLCIALLFSNFRKGKFAFNAKILRSFIVLISIIFYTYWFFRSSTIPQISDSVRLKIENKLPQTVDFYVIEVLQKKKAEEKKYEVHHSGKIRSYFYRNENLDLKNADEYWISGYLGKKDMVYFSQQIIRDRKAEQKVEVNNYINQSQKLSKIANEIIAKERLIENRKSVFIALSFLLIFLNFVLLFRRG